MGLESCGPSKIMNAGDEMTSRPVVTWPEVG